MSALDKKVRRDVIPRWRLASSSRNDLDSLPAGKSREELRLGPQQNLSALLKQFDLTKKPMLAAEVLSAAIAQGDRAIASDAAQRLLKFDLQSRPTLAALVDRVLASEKGNLASKAELGSPEETSRHLIRKYRKLVRAYPHNPLGWLDLAFTYAAIGQTEQAKVAVLTANSLERDHRAVVRASSRFFVHSGDFDRALSVITRSNLLKSDPWLVSAHIATSRAGGVTSRLIGAGRKMFKDERHRADQVSELGAALATNELEHGNAKLAERLVKRALVKPTENAVAQVAWLESIGDTDFQASSMASKLPDAWEARTFETYERQEWRASCDEAAAWLIDQPFSSRPAVHGSYVAATFLEDYELALRFSEAGYRANPTDIVVANNYVVCLAELGRIADARKVFGDSTKDLGSNWRPTLRATEGLLLYREGHIGAGREAYSQARDYFAARKDIRNELLASVYQAREERRLGNVAEAKELLIPVLEIESRDAAFDLDALRQLADRLKSDGIENPREKMG